MANPIRSQILNFKESPEVKTLSTTDKLVAIEGPIGVGKTSLVRMLCDRWKASPFFETFDDNPFLTNGFYDDTAKFAFNTEVFFLLSRFRQQQAIKSAKGLVISDYFFEKNSIFARMNLDREDFGIFQTVYDQFLPKIRQPDLIIFLKADLETLIRRIYFRDRRFERSLSPSYLEGLMNDYYHFFSSYSKSPVLTISTSGLDFVNDPQDFNRLLAMIEERIQGQVQLTLKTKIREIHA